MSGPFEGKAVLTGAGKSQVGRRLGRTGLDLTLEAVLRAIEDAGLSPDDIDGIASYPGPGVPDPGFSGATIQEVRNALGLHGMGFLHEACVQMWGEGGDRQAPKTPEVVAVGVGGGPVAGSMLLSNR